VTETNVTEVTKPIDEMTKDELREAALLHGVELDMSKKRAELIVEVKKLQDGEPGDGNDPDEKEPEKPKAVEKASKKGNKEDDRKYLKHPANGRVYVATEHLAKRGDMIPCDKNGRPG
jgi:hypothetical protein